MCYFNKSPHVLAEHRGRAGHPSTTQRKPILRSMVASWAQGAAVFLALMMGPCPLECSLLRYRSSPWGSRRAFGDPGVVGLGQVWGGQCVAAIAIDHVFEHAWQEPAVAADLLSSSSVK